MHVDGTGNVAVVEAILR